MTARLLSFLDLLVLLVLACEIALAALIDMRERRFPHVLSVVFTATCAVVGALHAGLDRFAWHVFSAAAVMALLLASEILWRRMHGGAAGLGGGDVKFLAALMLADPLYALASFILGLCLLAVCGLLTQKAALPLLPFVAIGCALVPLAALFP